MHTRQYDVFVNELATPAWVSLGNVAFQNLRLGIPCSPNEDFGTPDKHFRVRCRWIGSSLSDSMRVSIWLAFYPVAKGTIVVSVECL